MAARFGLHQLAGHPQLSACLPHAPLKDVADAKLPPYVADVDALALKGKGGVACYHE